MSNTNADAAKTIDQLIADERAADAAWAASTTHAGYTIAALREAFAAVQNAENWKLPINAVVPADAAGITVAAVGFMVGGACRRQVVAGGVRITNAGYYANIGA